jgi:hypothetical protein
MTRLAIVGGIAVGMWVAIIAGELIRPFGFGWVETLSIMMGWMP